MKHALALFFYSVFICSQVFGHGKPSEEADTIYRFVNRGEKIVVAIAQAEGLDVAGVNIRENTVDLVLSTSSLKMLDEKYGLKPLASNPIRTQARPDDGYHNFSEVHVALQNFKDKYPDLVELYVIGLTTDGRNIEAVKISDNASESETGEPAILFNAMHHAREVMTTEVAIDTIDYLLSHYATDEAVKTWIDQSQIWVVPMLNPDGNHKVWTQNNMWRKNTGAGGWGVDLNRNYPFNWNRCNGSSSSKHADTYRGPSSGSEPETKALMNLVKEIRPVFDISYHSYSEMVLYPYGCKNQNAGNKQLLASIGKSIAERIASDVGNNQTYAYGTPWELLYEADGSDIDWMHGTYGVIPYVIELNHTSLGFQPSYSQWRNKTVTKLRNAWGYLLDRLQQSGVRGTVRLDNSTNADNIFVHVSTINQESPIQFSQPLKKDGSFHFVLDPGMYKLSLSHQGTIQEANEILVGSELVDLNALEFSTQM